MPFPYKVLFPVFPFLISSTVDELFKLAVGCFVSVDQEGINLYVVLADIHDTNGAAGNAHHIRWEEPNRIEIE